MCCSVLVSGWTAVLSVWLSFDQVLFSAGLLLDCCPFCFVRCRPRACQRWSIVGLLSFLFCFVVLGLCASQRWSLVDCCPFCCVVFAPCASQRWYMVGLLSFLFCFIVLGLRASQRWFPVDCFPFCCVVFAPCASQRWGWGPSHVSGGGGD